MYTNLSFPCVCAGEDNAPASTDRTLSVPCDVTRLTRPDLLQYTVQQYKLEPSAWPLSNIILHLYKTKKKQFIRQLNYINI